jgi:hypothetical protein
MAVIFLIISILVVLHVHFRLINLYDWIVELSAFALNKSRQEAPWGAVLLSGLERRVVRDKPICYYFISKFVFTSVPLRNV